MNLEEMNEAEMLNAVLNGELSLDGEFTHNETIPPAESKAEKAEAEQYKDEADKPKEAKESQETEAPILSKSGKYTIPYEELSQARERAKELKSENEILKSQLAELSSRQQANLSQAQADADMRADAGQAATQADKNLQVAQAAMGEGVDVSVFGDFSEEDMAKGIAILQARERDKMLAEVKAQIQEELRPIKQQREQAEVDAHYGAIYSKHQDADDIVQSAEFAAWREALPAFMRAGMEDALKNGTAEQIIEVFDAFKQATEQPKTKAKPALEVQRRVPNSLSEIAGEPHQDTVQKALDTASRDPAALMLSMQDMSPAQIERLLAGI